ncbi:MAG TPA: AIR synthase-related protein, partial [Planctomycetaceae bacterium]|nr:AIR synthase-related protein [Planctomycetaceae bacterium]
GLEGGAVPKVSLDLAPRVFSAIHEAIRQGHVRSCHDLSEGGLAVSIAEMAFAGGLGALLDLQLLAKSSGVTVDVVLLFSESNSRFVVEMPSSSQAAFESLCRAADVPVVKLGDVTSADRLVIHGADGAVVIDSPLAELKAFWKRPLAWDQ